MFASPTMRQGALDLPSAVIEFTIIGENLVGDDTFSSIDPVVVVFDASDAVVGHGAGAINTTLEPRVVGHTEVLVDTKNPAFDTRVRFEYLFEKRQRIRFVLYDAKEKLAQKKLQSSLNYALIASNSVKIAEIDIAPSQLLRSKSDTTQVTLTRIGNPQKQVGTLYIKTRNLNRDETLHITFAAVNLPKKKIFLRPDPFIAVTRLGADGNSQAVVAKSEYIPNSLNPAWRELSIKLGHLVDLGLSGPDMSAEVGLDIYDKNISNERHIGGTVVSLARLLEPGCELSLTKVKRGVRDLNVEYGKLLVRSANLKTKMTFVDYLRAGVELSFSVAIDMTASNGDPADTNSLHYLDPSGRHNQYEAAISACGLVLSEYDTDGKVPVYGFGAVVPGSSRVSHDFHVNFCPDPAVNGMEQILGAYRNCLSQVTLYGPTNFSPVIRKQCELARSTLATRGNHVYHVLLIVTDGIISDLQDTKDAIAEATELPISIVIVGVGSEDFSSMRVLDGDDVQLRDSQGRLIKRDIVQFVEFNKYIGFPPRVLLAEVLHEIPAQLVDYMSRHAPDFNNMHNQMGYGSNSSVNHVPKLSIPQPMPSQPMPTPVADQQLRQPILQNSTPVTPVLQSYAGNSPMTQIGVTYPPQGQL